MMSPSLWGSGCFWYYSLPCHLYQLPEVVKRPGGRGLMLILPASLSSLPCSIWGTYVHLVFWCELVHVDWNSDWLMLPLIRVGLPQVFFRIFCRLFEAPTLFLITESNNKAVKIAVEGGPCPFLPLMSEVLCSSSQLCRSLLYFSLQIIVGKSFHLCGLPPLLSQSSSFFHRPDNLPLLDFS